MGQVKPSDLRKSPVCSPTAPSCLVTLVSQQFPVCSSTKSVQSVHCMAPYGQPARPLIHVQRPRHFQNITHPQINLTQFNECWV